MKRAMALLLIAAAALSACKSEGQKAEERLTMVKKQAISQAEICAAAREVAAAYLRDRDNEHYPLAKSGADLECTKADVDRLSGR